MHPAPVHKTGLDEGRCHSFSPVFVEGREARIHTIIGCKVVLVAAKEANLLAQSCAHGFLFPTASPFRPAEAPVLDGTRP